MRKKPKGELVRLFLDPESGLVLIDAKATMEGRGGYACRECLPDLRLNRRIQRAFRNGVKQLCVAQDIDIKEINLNP
jgi:predicted RNA-binding protein YlxR (DUF448 family)